MLAFLVWPLEGLGNIQSSWGGVFGQTSLALNRQDAKQAVTCITQSTYWVLTPFLFFV
jgi:hypothetical protein